MKKRGYREAGEPGNRGGNPESRGAGEPESRGAGAAEASAEASVPWRLRSPAEPVAHRIRGKAVLLGDGMSTDAMIAGKYCKMADPPQLGNHLFEGTGLNRKRWSGTIILAGNNFGCGSSREQAPMALKAAGVRAVAARSFGRIFFRNAVNIGLPVMNIEGIPEHVREGEEIILDLGRGVIRNRTREIIKGRPLPGILMGILRAGGLVPYTRAKLRIQVRADRSRFKRPHAK